MKTERMCTLTCGETMRIVDCDGATKVCSMQEKDWVMHHSWIVYLSEKKQKNQMPYDPERHPNVLLQVDKHTYRIICAKLLIAGGSAKCAGGTHKDKWVFYFYEPWHKKTVKIEQKVYQKEAVKQVFSHLGIIVRASVWYNAKFCKVHHDKNIVVRKRFNVHHFKYTLERTEKKKARVQCVLLQVLFDMEETHLEAFESLVQFVPHERLYAMRFFLLKFYLYCFDKAEKKMPSAHVFEATEYLTEKALNTCHAVLLDNKHLEGLEEVMQEINLYLSTWVLQTKHRRELAEPAYTYMDIERVSRTLTLKEAYDEWGKQTSVVEQLRNFDPDRAMEYTKSVDTILHRFDKQIVCVALDGDKAPKYIQNFKELIHLFWLFSNRFPLTNSCRLYRENNAYFKDIPTEYQEKLYYQEVTFICYCKK